MTQTPFLTEGDLIQSLTVQIKTH